MYFILYSWQGPSNSSWLEAVLSLVKNNKDRKGSVLSGLRNGNWVLILWLKLQNVKIKEEPCIRLT